MMRPYRQFLSNIATFAEINAGHDVDVMFGWECGARRDFGGAFGDPAEVAAECVGG